MWELENVGNILLCGWRDPKTPRLNGHVGCSCAWTLVELGMARFKKGDVSRS